MKLKLFLAASLFLVSIIFAKSASASEGEILLRNLIGGPSVCHAKSVLLGDYNILINCSNLLYPVSEDLVYYVVWATPINGGSATRLGDLGLGRSLLKTKTAFSELFVTQEKTKNGRTPTGTVVMRGTVRDIEILGSNQPSTISEQPAEIVEPTPEATPAPSRLSGLRTGAIVTIVAVFVIILMLILVKPFR